jgi:O-antigen/teichoic acid export membrane protein
MARTLTIESVAINLVAKGSFARDDFNAGFALSGSMAIAAAVLLVAAAPLAAMVFRIPALQSVLPQLAPLLAVFALARLFEAELTLDMAFRALAFRSLFAVALGGVAGIASAYAGQGVQALILQQWIAAVVSLALLALQARWRPGFRFSRTALSSLARQGAALAPAGFVSNLRQSIDGFAVASFSGAAAAGVYSLAKRTRLALQLGLTTAVARVSLPTFAQIKEDSARLSSAVRQALRLSAVVAFPVFVGIGATAPELIEVFLSPAWTAAAAPMAFLMIGGALAITTRLCENVLLVNGRRATIVAVNTAALIALAALVAALGKHGPVAIAASVLCVGIFQNTCAWVNATRHTPNLPLGSYFGLIWGPMTICVAMLALIGVLRAASVGAELPALLRLLAYVSVGAVFYVAVASVFAREGVLAALQATRVMFTARSAKA